MSSNPLENIQKEICYDNIHQKVSEHHPRRTGIINVLMKLNFFVFPILLVLMQNAKNGICVAVALI